MVRCVRDDVTGLVWEAKTDDGGLHDRNWYYTHYNPDFSSNAGYAGTEDGTDACFDISRCDTDKFVVDVNAAGLCGYRDWRLPSRTDLVSIVNFGASAPASDTTYFPDIGTGWWYWSASPWVGYSVTTGARLYVDFASGGATFEGSNSGLHVRLVRGEQFAYPYEGKYARQVQQMYVAYYGRPGDPAGVQYWAERLAQVGGNWIADLVNAFGNSAEYIQRYGALGDAVLIDNLYQQLFNRDAEVDGLNFYVDLLQGTNRTGWNEDLRRSTLAQIALDIANGSQNKDFDTLNNKLDVGEYFTELVDSTGRRYESADIDDAVAILSDVRSDAGSVDAAKLRARDFMEASQ